MLVEVQSWPYDFPESDDFPKWDERGNVCGRLMVKERCVLSSHNCFVIKISNATN